jgi:hypothetical protein
VKLAKAGGESFICARSARYWVKFCLGSAFKIVFGYSFRPLRVRYCHIATSNVVLGVGSVASRVAVWVYFIVPIVIVFDVIMG